MSITFGYFVEQTFITKSTTGIKRFQIYARLLTPSTLVLDEYYVRAERPQAGVRSGIDSKNSFPSFNK